MEDGSDEQVEDDPNAGEEASDDRMGNDDQQKHMRVRLDAGEDPLGSTGDQSALACKNLEAWMYCLPEMGHSPSSCCLQSGPGNRSLFSQAALRRNRWTGVSSLRSSCRLRDQRPNTVATRLRGLGVPFSSFPGKEPGSLLGAF
eukprot:2717150-Amphidinium_carterae.1